MIPKEIIELAIVGGWKVGHGAFDKCKNPKEVLETFNFCYPDDESIKQHRHWYRYALDATFWQALGKSCGWREIKSTTVKRTVWLYKAREFIHLILTNQPTDTFWQEIINANK